MISGYALAYGVTVVLETPVVALAYPKERLRMAVACILATSATHLFMHFVLTALVSRLQVWLVVGEASATVLEALVYWRASREHDVGRALAVSAVANTLSFAAGFVL